MNRRAFLRGLGLAPVAAAIAPALPAQGESVLGYASGGTIGPARSLVGEAVSEYQWVGAPGPQIVRLGRSTRITGAPPLRPVMEIGRRYIPASLADDHLMQRMAAHFD